MGKLDSIKRILRQPRTYGILALAVVLAAWCVLVEVWVALAFVWWRKHPDAEGYDSVLMLPLIRWEGAFQRPQHLAKGLAKYHPVVYIDPLPLHWVARDLAGSVRQLWYRDGGVLVTHPWTLPGENQIPALRWLNQWHITQWTRLIQMALGLRSPVFYTHVPTSGLMLGAFGEVLDVYDIIDDFTVASWARPDSRQRERELIERCQVVTTGTYELLMRKAAEHPRAQFINCGVDFNHFANPIGSPPEFLGALPGPVIGYFGVVNERIDGALLLSMARAHPEWSIVMIGPLHNDFELARFDSRWDTVVDRPAGASGLRDLPPNLQFPGLVPYSGLPACLARFDVAILPYRRTPVTEIIHPVKILEYFAGGKPVVCTALPDVERFYADAALLAHRPEEFTVLVERALAHPDPARLEHARAMALGRSWDIMTQEFREAFGRALPGATAPDQ